MEFNMAPLQTYLDDFGDTDETRIIYYKTFLSQTDYIASKIAEYNYLNKPIEEKYLEILNQREEARENIRQLLTK